MTAEIPRAQAVGSLLRPERLKRARTELRDGALSPYAFKRIEDAAVDDAIAIQRAAGLAEITDGEMRRGHFTDPLADSVDGLAEVPPPDHPAPRLDHDATPGGVSERAPTPGGVSHLAPHPDPDAPGRRSAQSGRDIGADGDPLRYTIGRVVVEKLRHRRSPAIEEYVYARARADGTPVKQTLPSPLMMQAYWSPEHSPAAYADPFDMFADAAEAVREQIRDLVALGCESIQIDAPELALLVDPDVREAFTRRGIDPRRMLTDGVDLLASLTEVPGPRYALHLCRGNKEGMWRAEGGYEAVAEEVFRRARGYGTFLLEYDDARSGGFAPLEAVPDDRYVVLGLISTKRPELEPEDELLSRIEEAARHHPRANLALSPQCGFASTLEGNPLTPDDQAAKLSLVTRVARRAFVPR